MRGYIQPDVLLVSPAMYADADKILNTREIPGSRIGNYVKMQYKEETPYWVWTNSLEYGSNKQPHVNDFIRNQWGEYMDLVEKCSLPKAMRKNGYIIKVRYIGYGEYSKSVIKGRILSKMVIEEETWLNTNTH